MTATMAVTPFLVGQGTLVHMTETGRTIADREERAER